MSKRGMRRTMVGVVVSNKMDKTVVVRVERLVQDPEYKKYVRRYSRFMAHDEERTRATSGTRSASSSTDRSRKRKRWKVQATLSEAPPRV